MNIKQIIEELNSNKNKISVTYQELANSLHQLAKDQDQTTFQQLVNSYIDWQEQYQDREESLRTLVATCIMADYNQLCALGYLQSGESHKIEDYGPGKTYKMLTEVLSEDFE